MYLGGINTTGRRGHITSSLLIYLPPHLPQHRRRIRSTSSTTVSLLVRRVDYDRNNRIVMMGVHVKPSDSGRQISSRHRFKRLRALHFRCRSVRGARSCETARGTYTHTPRCAARRPPPQCGNADKYGHLSPRRTVVVCPTRSSDPEHAPPKIEDVSPHRHASRRYCTLHPCMPSQHSSTSFDERASFVTLVNARSRRGPPVRTDTFHHWSPAPTPLRARYAPVYYTLNSARLTTVGRT